MAAGAGWLLGSGGNTVGTQSVVNTAAGVILDMINHEEKSGARSTRSSSGRKRPKPWDSFKDHRDWQYKEQDGETTNHDAQILMDSVLSAAGSAIKGSSWWGVFNGGGGEKEEKGSDSSSVSRVDKVTYCAIRPSCVIPESPTKKLTYTRRYEIERREQGEAEHTAARL
ncbi:hypothetical protein HHX47_DHR3000538 [Lentinula edodes]|nr:hypothetical protein HHX47_DHR3000538 [Lentinula edodes]